MRRTKTITVAMLAVVMVVAVVAISQSVAMSQLSSQYDLKVSATINGTGTLAEQRAAVLEANEIPDDYLIMKTGDIWNKHMTDDEIEKFESVYINMLVTGENTPSKARGISLSLTGHNFHTLAERPDTDLHEVIALLLHGKMLDGTYETPESEPLWKYHEYTLDLYQDQLPDTTQGIEERVIELTGEMAPLASVILDTHNQFAESGIVSFEQFGTDPDYWWAVVFLFECEYNAEHNHGNADDCDSDRDHLENKRWMEPRPEFIPPPSQDWPPYLNFILPLAHAWSYVSMDYELKYIAGGCSGTCPAVTPVSGTTSQYLSDTWEPAMGSNDGCGHLTGTGVYTIFKVERNVGTAYAASILQTEAAGISENDIDYGYRNEVAADTQTYVSPNPSSTWCYEADYTGYALN